MVRVAETSSDCTNLEAALSVWAQSAEHSCLGVIPLELDCFLTEPQARAEFFVVLERVRNLLADFGGEIPMETINAMKPELPGFYFIISPPTSRFLAASLQLEGLVRGTAGEEVSAETERLIQQFRATLQASRSRDSGRRG